MRFYAYLGRTAGKGWVARLPTLCCTGCLYLLVLHALAISSYDTVAHCYVWQQECANITSSILLATSCVNHGQAVTHPEIAAVIVPEPLDVARLSHGFSFLQQVCACNADNIQCSQCSALPWFLHIR
jgi:hypothetical protein